MELSITRCHGPHGRCRWTLMAVITLFSNVQNSFFGTPVFWIVSWSLHYTHGCIMMHLFESQLLVCQKCCTCLTWWKKLSNDNSMHIFLQKWLTKTHN
jgi:hypothetical protein